MFFVLVFVSLYQWTSSVRFGQYGAWRDVEEPWVLLYGVTVCYGFDAKPPTIWVSSAIRIRIMLGGYSSDAS